MRTRLTRRSLSNPSWFREPAPTLTRWSERLPSLVPRVHRSVPAAIPEHSRLHLHVLQAGADQRTSDAAPSTYDEGANPTQEHLPQIPSAFPRHEAIYIVGRNKGKVLTHDVGLNKLLAGTLRLDPTGGWAMENCRHPISEAGIGPLLDTLHTRWSSELDPPSPSWPFATTRRWAADAAR